MKGSAQYSILTMAILALAAVSGFLRPSVAQSVQRLESPPTNRVLELDGNGSYVELPEGIFDGVEEITVEGWVKWQQLRPYARFFDFVVNGDLLDVHVRPESLLSLQLFSKDKDRSAIYVPDMIATNQWFHIAAVATPKTKRLYLNGGIVGSAVNSHDSAIWVLTNYTKHSLLGKSKWAISGQGADHEDFQGQMDEVRVWNHARTAEQVREQMFQRLSGQEPGLLALWNFDEGTAADSSPAGHHGRLVGKARIGASALPVSVERRIWSRVRVNATDGANVTVRDVTFRAEVDGAVLPTSFTSSFDGAWLTVWTNVPAVDLVASSLNGLGCWQAEVRLSPGVETYLNVVLRPAINISGTISGLNGKPPMAAVPIELVLPEWDTASGPREGRHTAADRNRVLHLPAEGSYVQLPPGVFDHLTAATFEGWINWREMGEWNVFYDYGKRSDSCLSVGATDLASVYASVTIDPTVGHEVEAPKIVCTNTWYHIAYTTGDAGQRLFVNGVLMGTNSFTGSFAAIPKGAMHYLGRSSWRAINPSYRDTQGQMDEVRVWQTQRTAEQIRETMFQRLTGREPGLVGLWNFDDPAHPGRDASTNRHHGKVMGQAAVGDEELPAVVSGNIADARGKPLGLATVSVREANGEQRRLAANASGEYAFPVYPTNRCDVFVTSGTLSAYKLGFQPTGEPFQHLNWILADPSETPVPSSDFRQPEVTPNPLSRAPSAAGPSEAREPGVGSPHFPLGTVVARTLSDEHGYFSFPNVKPGVYQLRAQVPGRYEWFDAGRLLYARPDLLDAQRAQLKTLDFRMAPFKKGLWTTYDSTSGLPLAQIRKFWIDPEGLLWIATLGGVSRFDGNTFASLTTEDGLLDDRVFNLWREPSGIWWFCTARGVSRYDPQAVTQGRRPFRNYTSQECHVRGEIHAITQTSDGAIWFGSNEGSLSCLVNDNFVPYSAPGETILKIAADRKGLLWLGTWNGLVRFDGTNFVNVTRALGVNTDADSPEVAPDGSVWFGGNVAKTGLWHYILDSVEGGPGRLRRWTQQDGLVHDKVFAPHLASDGRLWAATKRGVSAYDGTCFVNFTSADGLSDDEVLTVTSTESGTVWFGTVRGKVYRYETDRFTQFNLADGLIAPNTMGSGGFEPNMSSGFESADASLWFSSGFYQPKQGLARFNGRYFKAIPTGPGSFTNAVTSFAADRSGAMWVGLYGKGILRYARGQFELFRSSDGLAGDDVNCLARAADGRLWIGTDTHGLSRYDGQTFQNFTTNHDLSTLSITSLGAGSSNEVWVGTYGGGALCYDGTRFRRYLATDGLADDTVFKILTEPSGDVWFGTPNGLSRLAGGKFTTYSRGKDRLADNTILDLWRDAQGVLWIASPSGVTRYDGNAWSTLTTVDGLGGNAVLSILQDRNGAFWFGTENGLTRHIPDRTPPRPPRVTMLADQEYANATVMAEVIAGRRVSFKLGVVDLKTRGELRRFRWRFDSGTPSIDAGRLASGWLPATRETQFEWSTNRAGTYTFAAQYLDRDLNYSPPTILRLNVVAPWYANMAFIVPTGGVTLSLLLFSVFSTTRALKRKQEAQRLRERLFKEEHAAREAAERARAEIELRNAQLAAAKEEADAANQSKSRFLASMSHELRTPLNAIIGYSEMLQEEAPEMGAAALVPDLQKIHGAAKHQLGLINDILDLSKIEAGKMTLFIEEFDPAKLVQEVAATTQPLVAKNGNQLATICPPDLGAMRSDQTKLRQVLFNLLSNAAKFTEKGTITLRVSKSEGRRVKGEGKVSLLHFSVTDTGIGMTPEQVGRLFQAFSQAEATTQVKYGGTGLGLAISRRFCQLLGGEIEVTSTPGKGSTFTVVLPINCPSTRGNE